jgi:LysM repeat protein
MKAFALRRVAQALALVAVIGVITPVTVLAATQQAPIQSMHQPSQTVHIVKRGDTLGTIARQYGTTIKALAEANGIKNPNVIYLGQRIVIPGAAMPKPKQPAKQPEQPAKQPPQHRPAPQQPVYDPCLYYTAKAGDSVISVAQQFGIEPGALVEANRDMGRPPMIDAGKTYCIPKKSSEPAKPTKPGAGKPSQPHTPEPPATTQWKGFYYADKYFEKLVTERLDPEVRFNWYKGKPGDNLPEDRFSVRWEKSEYFKPGRYRFTATADDGVRVYVNDQLIIDGWKIQPVTTYTADIQLSGGHHKLVVEYYEEAEDAEIHVYWEMLNPNR